MLRMVPVTCGLIGTSAGNRRSTFRRDDAKGSGRGAASRRGRYPTLAQGGELECSRDVIDRQLRAVDASPLDWETLGGLVPDTIDGKQVLARA